LIGQSREKELDSPVKPENDSIEFDFYALRSSGFLAVDSGEVRTATMKDKMHCRKFEILRFAQNDRGQRSCPSRVKSAI
jgi:hypothetical protein